MTIGEMASRAGVPTSTVRYYERKTLIEPDARESGQRRYGPPKLRRLIFIGMLQDAGLSLEDIRGVLEASSKGEWKEIGQRRLELLESEIDRLERARTYLRGALLCPFDHPLTDCNVMATEIDHRISRGRPGRDWPSTDQAPADPPS